MFARARRSPRVVSMWLSDWPDTDGELVDLVCKRHSFGSRVEAPGHVTRPTITPRDLLIRRPVLIATTSCCSLTRGNEGNLSY